jgi:ANTAR domain-containing protein
MVTARGPSKSAPTTTRPGGREAPVGSLPTAATRESAAFFGCRRSSSEVFRLALRVAPLWLLAGRNLNALGLWLSSGGLARVQIGFGERSYTLLAAPEGKPNDPTAFLLERTIQLQTALDSRIVIEQAKGILAKRQQITP